VVKTIVGTFFGLAFFAVLYLLGTLAFGGRMHFWQAYSVAAFVGFPWLILQKGISFIILFVKSPDDIHPLIGQESLVTDNLGILFKSAEHPVLFVAASAIGLLSFYRLWLAAKGLHEAGYRLVPGRLGCGDYALGVGLLLGMSARRNLPSFLS